VRDGALPVFVRGEAHGIERRRDGGAQDFVEEVAQPARYIIQRKFGLIQLIRL
jgi:hypothetical protein